ncbi:MAG: hypothetical protein JO100_12970 [Pseudonocardia sp.]|nr:hypothetical protein [Pseudonocardia sp.]
MSVGEQWAGSGGFRRELILDDDRHIRLAIYFRELPNGYDVVAVYSEQTARLPPTPQQAAPRRCSGPKFDLSSG